MTFRGGWGIPKSQMSSLAPEEPTLPANPNTGHITKGLTHDLLLAIPRKRVFEKVNQLLDMTRFVKSEGKEKPDSRAIEAGVKLWSLLYSLGLPPAGAPGSVQADPGAEIEGLEARMRRSPALREMVKGMVERAEAHAAANARPGRVVEATIVQN